jgi:hypothetical protein
LIPIPFIHGLAIKGEKIGKYHVPVFTSEIVLVLMQLRWYFIINSLRGSATYTDLYSKKIYKTFGSKVDRNIVFKILNLEFSSTFAFFMFLWSVFILTLLMQISESSYQGMIGNNQLDNIGKVATLITVTMTTVGYGNIASQSSLGRIIACCTAFWGVFVLSLLVGTVQ